MASLLEALPRPKDPDVLVGTAIADDAGVYRLREDLALVQSVDFFTPIVDDPHDFGRIAAANSLSDIYAMGARPVTALNLVAWPVEDLGTEALAQVLRGGEEVASAAGVAVLGGHTIDDAEPKYGLSVTGTVNPRELLTIAGGRPGDALALTKPVGAGVVATALKKGLAADQVVAAAVAVMTELNAAAAAAARAADAHAVTDVTGFGLLGHLHGLATASGVAAEVNAEAVPEIPGVLDLLKDGRTLAGGTRRNREEADTYTAFAPTVSESRRWLVCDAMTSGGLLIATSADRTGKLPGVVIGHLVEGEPGQIRVN
ncbi:MAG: selenide, water dikinase SelD [Solirubrobacterales bacterium]|nr:selenide, water dikinase SelD [Solirubrobacterales bacterium]MBV9536270.1 selenide, water dikinase SelD [Solirubrobacterales bacterium]